MRLEYQIKTRTYTVPRKNSQYAERILNKVFKDIKETFTKGDERLKSVESRTQYILNI